MDSSNCAKDAKIYPLVCCCCLTNILIKDLTTDIISSDIIVKDNNYTDIIRETFNIEIKSHLDDEIQDHLLCEECKAAVSAANQFRNKVLESQEKFLDHWKYLNSNSNRPDGDEVTCVKAELVSQHDYEDSNYQYDEIKVPAVFDIQNDEVITSFKLEDPSRELRSYERRVSRRRGRGAATDVDARVTESKREKDWAKITERRGTGPILRENSLKLLANSTICVFQWNRSRYRCFCCMEPFSDMSTLRQHTHSTHTLENIEKKIIIQQNRLVKVEVSTLTCKICDTTLNDLPSLRRHLQETHSIQFGAVNEDLLVPFKLETGRLECQLCSESFTVFRLLNIHMNKHYQKQVCHICGAGFSNLVFLNLHKTRSHRPLKCDICNIEFESRSEKRQHEISAHNVRRERKLRFPCPLCEHRFFQENLKIRHLVDAHGMTEPQHECSVCAKVFITRSLRNNHHKNVHLKEKKRECDVCQMRFYTRSDVARHRVTHTGEKNFSCGLCNNLFATKDSLRRHLKRTHVSVS